MPKTLKILLFLVVSIAFAILVGYGYIYIEIFKLVSRLADGMYWITVDISRLVSGIVATACTGYVLTALFRATLLLGSASDFAVLAMSIASSLGSAYFDRLGFFRTGKEVVYLCSPVHPRDTATIERKGQGEAFGKRCVAITPDNAGVAYAIDGKLAPERIKFGNSSDAADYRWFKDGVASVWFSQSTDENGLNKLYNGPGFDPDSSNFLSPVTITFIEEYKSRLRNAPQRSYSSSQQIRRQFETAKQIFGLTEKDEVLSKLVDQALGVGDIQLAEEIAKTIFTLSIKDAALKKVIQRQR